MRWNQPILGDRNQFRARKRTLQPGREQSLVLAAGKAIAEAIEGLFAEVAREVGFDLSSIPMRAVVNAGEPGANVPSTKARIEEAWKEAERNALGRSAEPSEVADVIVYLAGPMASFVSGVALPVTGAANPGV